MAKVDGLNNIFQDTPLTAMQLALLNRMAPLFARVADIVGAQVVLGVKSNENNKYVLLRGFSPHTTFNPVTIESFPTVLQLEINNKVEEVFRLKKKVNMGISTILGSNMFLYLYPIMSEDEVIAVALCGVMPEEVNSFGFQRLLETGETIIKHGERSLIACPNMEFNHNMGLLITDKFSRVIFSNKIAQQIYYQLGINNLQGLYTDNPFIYSKFKREILSLNDPYTKEIATNNLVLIRREWPIYEAGNLILKIITIEDITEIREKDKEIKVKSAVIQEIHHRMKNSLQTVASLLRMQGRRNSNQEVKKALSIAENRILSIGLVHEMLSIEEQDAAEVGKVLENIAHQISMATTHEDFSLDFQFKWDYLVLPSSKISNIAMIFNELLLNSLEHGFCNKKNGVIICTLVVEDNEMKLSFSDNGIGYSEEILAGKNKSLGLKIIETLVVDQLKGSYKLYNKDGAHLDIVCKILY